MRKKPINSPARGRRLKRVVMPRPKVIPMPSFIGIYNANNDPCDMAQGPCCCGAWHTLDYWPKKVRAAIMRHNDQAQR